LHLGDVTLTFLDNLSPEDLLALTNAMTLLVDFFLCNVQGIPMHDYQLAFWIVFGMIYIHHLLLLYNHLMFQTIST
jgi:hypothetical protein